MTKRFVGSSGHGLKIRGAKHFIDEVVEARKVTNEIHRILTTQYNGAGSVYHDNTSTSQNQNLQTIVKFHNGQQRDLDWSIHFNAASVIDGPRGVEVLYYDAKDLSARVSTAISKASGLKNRGAKQRTELYFLKNTTKPAILLEICFVDSKADVELYHRNFASLCAAIAEVLATHLGYSKKQTEIQTGEHTLVQELLNETGRNSCKEMIQRGVSEGLFTSKHENLSKYSDKELISYAIAYVNRKTK